MKQQEKNLPASFPRACVRELFQGFILTLGITALVALATGVHADLRPKFGSPQVYALNPKGK